MTPQQAYLVRKSFALVEEHQNVAALVFYRRLFEIAPEVRPLFKDDIQEQAKKLTDMLGSLISMLERPASLDIELREMGARHATYGVKDEHYQIVGQAMMGMLADVCGVTFTAPVQEAWGALYGAVEATMRRGAAEAPAAPAG